ncbi:MAG: hypothetical protein NWF00_07800 [Candidatus Bathyarchaeota archaeon]|nr:hypothetical protein [Candidatus Bathyarchaeota archaeon]
MLFGHKSNKLQVDLGDLEDQQEKLSQFLESHLKVTVKSERNKLGIEPETTDPKELQRVVTKFIYHRNLNGTHWASTDGNVIKIRRFKGTAKKPKKKEKNATHETLPQSWGL